jgi:predicted TIM-barrel fold metal-dependent hydrolase
VLYPTGGLAVGKINNRGWAVALTRAYNDWLYERYLSKSSRLNAVGLVPLQEPEAAIQELERIVTQLGLAGAMLPANGLNAHLGSKEYWPIYAEANRLGCCLAVHGGCHDGFGFDDMNVYAPVHALGHPFGLMISFAGILFNRVFDRYPNLRMGFLEGGVGWFGACIERFDRSAETHTQVDPQDEMLVVRDGEKVSDYVLDLVRAGRLFVGCEGDEATLVSMIRLVGAGAFMYSSDFPHEVNSDYCKHEIAEFLENESLTDEEKTAVLHGNAERFYRLAR